MPEPQLHDWRRQRGAERSKRGARRPSGRPIVARLRRATAACREGRQGSDLRTYRWRWECLAESADANADALGHRWHGEETCSRCFRNEVYVNQSLHAMRERFVLAHEIGHSVLDDHREVFAHLDDCHRLAPDFSEISRLARQLNLSHQATARRAAEESRHDCAIALAFRSGDGSGPLKSTNTAFGHQRPSRRDSGGPPEVDPTHQFRKPSRSQPRAAKFPIGARWIAMEINSKCALREWTHFTRSLCCLSQRSVAHSFAATDGCEYWLAPSRFGEFRRRRTAQKPAVPAMEPRCGSVGRYRT